MRTTMKEKSIFHKIMINNLLISLIPFCCILVLTYLLVCSNYRNEKIQQAQKYANAYANDITTSLDESFNKSNYVLKYKYMIDNIDNTFSTAAKALEFIDITSEYFDTIFSEGDLDTLIIYHSNDTIFESKYFLKINRLVNADELFEYFETNNTGTYLDERIYTDIIGKKYFNFYKKMQFNENCIVAFRSYLPDASAFKDNIQLINVGEQIPENSVSCKIFDNVYCSAIIEENMLIYFLYAILFIIIGIFFILIVIYLTYKATQKTTKEIESFLNSLDKSDILSMNISEIRSGPPELTIIKKVINNLIHKIKTYSDEQYKYEIEKKNLQMQLLRSKLNLHMLYNSLSVIKLKAFRYGDKDILSIVDNLSSYYRLSLNNGKEFISVSDEFELLKKFVYVNEVSHNKKYTLEISADTGILDIKIPHMLLQPFVENSILHGLNGSEKPGIIKISGKKNNDFLIFKIYDNGHGISPETLNIINNMENNTERYGIRNTYLRLCNTFGSDSKIHFDSEEGKFTEVTITISLKNYKTP